jgi:FdhE protein
VEEARAELDRVLANRPSFAPVLRWLRELLPDLEPISTGLPSVTLEAEQARARLSAGVPLLRGERIEVGEKAFVRRWERACAALEAEQPDGAAAALSEAVRRGRLPAGEMIGAVVAGQPELVRERAAALGLEPGLATTVLRFVLFPVFAGLEMALAALREGVNWEHGNCPTCGSWPLLAELRGLDQSRSLRCGLCAAGWAVPRLWCPFCGNRDHERLGLLHSAGEEGKYRAAVCEECRGHIKTLSTLSELPPLLLLVADAATMHLDLAAAERGYAGPE